MSAFPQIIQKPRMGTESLHFEGQCLSLSILDFWRWSASDLLSNATRGRFAEFIVASALNISLDQVREEWGAYDLLTQDGIRVEVKSAAYIQSWHQSKLSVISFLVPKTRAWEAKTGLQETEARRQADVYVFALLAHNDQTTIDPLNINQWDFYVLPTVLLNARTRSQHSITLRSLVKLSGGAVTYDNLEKAISTAALQNKPNQ